MQLFVAMQRLGLIPSNRWLPGPTYFIPFTDESPIQAPLPPDSLHPQALLSWVGSVFISATPFLVWVMTQRLIRDWKPQIWAEIFKKLPSTVFYGKRVPPPPPPPSIRRGNSSRENRSQSSSGDDRVGEDETTVGATHGSEAIDESDPAERPRRPSAAATTGDDFASDEEDNEGVSATLISFDVEATESTDAPAGLWSAELRPSQNSLPAGVPQPVYLDTLLTQLPALMASHILTDAIARIIIAPYEATALRLAARAYCLRHGLPYGHILSTNLLSGLGWVSAVNFLGVELLHLSLLGEVWTVFTSLAQWFHLSEDEWKEADGKELNWYAGWW